MNHTFQKNAIEFETGIALTRHETIYAMIPYAMLCISVYSSILSTKFRGILKNPCTLMYKRGFWYCTVRYSTRTVLLVILTDGRTTLTSTIQDLAIVATVVSALMRTAQRARHHGYTSCHVNQSQEESQSQSCYSYSTVGR